MKDTFDTDPASIAHRRMLGERDVRWKKVLLFLVLAILFVFAAAAQQQ